MRHEHLLIDAPVAALNGVPADEERRDGLVFSRAFRASPEHMMRHWLEPGLRQRWLPLPAPARMLPIAQAFPTSLRATVTDGTHSAYLELLLQDDGPVTVLRLTIVPVAPLTRDMLINTGHGDRWEAALYALADLLAP